MSDERGGPGREPPEPTPLLGPAIGIALLIAVTYFTIDAFHHWNRVQTCITAGHRDCDR